MKPKKPKILLDIISQSCIIFTVVFFVLALFCQLISQNTVALPLKNAAIFYLFAFWVSAVNVLLKKSGLGETVSMLIRFAATTAGFYIIIQYLPGKNEGGAKTFIITIVFAVIYIITAAVVLSIKNMGKKKRADKSDYKSVYKKSDDA